jgi:sugar phosphate isomerase/epimerase
MQLGIFAKTFVRPTLGATLDAVIEHGLNCIQFNFACVGLPSLPDRIEPELARMIQVETQRRGLSLSGVSATFNMIHPDEEKRSDGLRRLAALAAICPVLRASVLTLCTGTRDPENMWRRHPANDTAEAWNDLLRTMSSALDIAEQFRVTLGVEPETANIVSSALKARRLLDEIKSPRLKIIMDAANLFRVGELSRQREILNEAFDLVGGDLVMAHAKDVRETGAEIEHVAAGTGSLDYEFYVAKLREAQFPGPLILHGLAEAEVKGSVAFLQATMTKRRSPKAATSAVNDSTAPIKPNRLTSAAPGKRGPR